MTWDPKVGDGATLRLHTDCRAFTVTCVSSSGKTITMQRDRATLLNGLSSGAEDALTFTPGGFCGHTSGRQRYEYERNTAGELARATRRRLPDGKVIWKQVGARTKSPGFRVTEGRHEFFDYNF